MTNSYVLLLVPCGCIESIQPKMYFHQQIESDTQIYALRGGKDDLCRRWLRQRAVENSGWSSHLLGRSSEGDIGGLVPLSEHTAIRKWCIFMISNRPRRRTGTSREQQSRPSSGGDKVQGFQKHFHPNKQRHCLRMLNSLANSLLNPYVQLKQVTSTRDPLKVLIQYKYDMYFIWSSLSSLNVT